MRGVNKVFLMGHVGRDPEIKKTQSGMSIATFSIATSERVKRGNEWEDHTEWHNLVAFGRTAEIVDEYVSKGSAMHVEGKLRTQSWEDKNDGKKRYRTEIIVDQLNLLGDGGGGKKDSSESKSRNSGKSKRSERDDNTDSEPEEELMISDEDIPF